MGIVRIVIFDEFFLRVIHAEYIVVNCDSARYSAPYRKEWPIVCHSFFREVVRDWGRMEGLHERRVRFADTQDRLLEYNRQRSLTTLTLRQSARCRRPIEILRTVRILTSPNRTNYSHRGTSRVPKDRTKMHYTYYCAYLCEH